MNGVRSSFFTWLLIILNNEDLSPHDLQVGFSIIFCYFLHHNILSYPLKVSANIMLGWSQHLLIVQSKDKQDRGIYFWRNPKAYGVTAYKVFSYLHYF